MDAELDLRFFEDDDDEEADEDDGGTGAPPPVTDDDDGPVDIEDATGPLLEFMPAGVAVLAATEIARDDDEGSLEAELDKVEVEFWAAAGRDAFEDWDKLLSPDTPKPPPVDDMEMAAGPIDPDPPAIVGPPAEVVVVSDSFSGDDGPSLEPVSYVIGLYGGMSFTLPPFF